MGQPLICCGSKVCLGRVESAKAHLFTLLIVIGTRDQTWYLTPWLQLQNFKNWMILNWELANFFKIFFKEPESFLLSGSDLIKDDTSQALKFTPRFKARLKFNPLKHPPKKSYDFPFFLNKVLDFNNFLQIPIQL